MRIKPLFELQLRTRLFIIMFVVIALFSLYISYRFTREINEQFQYYERMNRERSIIDIVTYLEAIYRQDKGWSLRSGQDSIRYAMRNGQTVTLMNDHRDVIWEISKQTTGIAGTSRAQRSQGAHWSTQGLQAIEGTLSYNHRAKLEEHFGYEIIEKPIKYNGWVVGYVMIGSYTQDSSLHPEGSEMKQYLLVSASGTLVVGLLLAALVAMVVSHYLSVPLRKLTRVAVAMQSGKLNHQLEDKSGMLEIAQLTRALNYLALSLKDQRALRKRLTSDISHELRTPLNALLALSEAYMDGIVEVNQESLQKFRSEILRLASLVGELSKLSDLEDDNLTLQTQEVDLQAILSDLAFVYGQLSTKDNHQFEFDLSANVMIQADADRFKQAIINLLGNAIKYTPEGGSIKLLSYMDKYHVYISIVDTGYGIPDEEKEHIFERFYRLEQSRNRSTGGVGLGLTLVKRIVDAHGWQISVTNNIPKGSIFSIIMPNPQYNPSQT